MLDIFSNSQGSKYCYYDDDNGDDNGDDNDDDNGITANRVL